MSCISNLGGRESLKIAVIVTNHYLKTRRKYIRFTIVNCNLVHLCIYTVWHAVYYTIHSQQECLYFNNRKIITDTYQSVITVNNILYVVQGSIDLVTC